MKKLFTIFLFSGIFLVAGSYHAIATNFIGANLTYTYLGGYSYQITLSYYRDCSKIVAPPNVNINLFCSSNSAYNFIVQLPKISSTGAEITPYCNSNPTSCANISNYGLGVQEHVYQQNVTLPPCGSWTMSFTSCCRNPNPVVNTSSSYLIPALLNNSQGQNNSSPIFIDDPVVVVCSGQNVTINNIAIDPNGDSLVYSLYAPQRTGGSSVIYTSPYSYNNFLPSNPPITINTNTGDICFNSSQELTTLYGLKVEEYRTINGIPTFIGAIYRDIQLEIISCNNHIPKLSGIDTMLSHTYNSNDTIFSIERCFNTTPIIFDINGFDADTFNSAISGNPEEFNISWNNGISTASFTPHNNGTDSAYAEFSWLPTTNDLNTTKCFIAKIKDEACPYKGVNSYMYCITIRGMSIDIGSDTLLCKGENITITANADSSTVNYIWSINGTSAGVPPNQDWVVINSTNLGPGHHILSIETNDGNTAMACPGTDTKNINIVYQPIINGTMPDSSFCNNSSIIYDAGQGYFYSWTNLVLGGMPVGTSQTLQINSSGTYRIEVDGGNQTRCIDVDTFNATAFPVPPIVDFGNDTTISSNQTLNLSLPSGYTDYSWSTGATTQSIVIDSTYNWVNNIIGKVTVNNQCFSTDNIYVYIGSVGFNENSKDKVQIFPNPVSNSLNIELKNDNKDTKIRIHNINGQLIRTESFTGKNHEVKSLESLENGVYILYLSNSDIDVIMKFVKE